jgi:hypothetical protein
VIGGTTGCFEKRVRVKTEEEFGGTLDLLRRARVTAEEESASPLNAPALDTLGNEVFDRDVAVDADAL